ncbi:hypothetical protein D3C72_1000750 [compost metagenome]
MIDTMINMIQNFGFPMTVAVWALWRLDKNWGKGENIQGALKNIEDSIDEVKIVLTKNTEAIVELAFTIKLLEAIIRQDIIGGNKDAN